MIDLNDKFGKAREGDNKSEVKDDTYITDNDNHVISHLKLRKTIGVLAFILPITLILGSVFVNNGVVLPSISHYYHSAMKILFTGVLFTIATFFWTFQGDNFFETTLNRIAAICGTLVALIPTNNSKTHLLEEGESYSYSQLTGFQCYSVAKEGIVGKLHLFFALIFFVILIIMVISVFLPREKRNIEPAKWKITIYQISGYGMIICILLIGLFMSIGEVSFPSTFIFEWIALALFGLAWFVKGQDEDGLKKPAA
jgi:hypothetical protein